MNKLGKLKALGPGLIGLVKVSIPCFVVALVCYAFYRLARSFYIMSKPNEWLLVIRNGYLKSSGIGIAQWILPFDRTVTFPSMIN